MTTISTLSDLIEGEDYWIKSKNFKSMAKVKCLAVNKDGVLLADLKLSETPSDQEIDQALKEEKIPRGSFILRKEQLSGNTIIKIN